MLKSRLEAYCQALGWNSQEVLPLNSTFPKIRESGLRVGWLAPKVIRRPAPSSERAGSSKRGIILYMTPIREIYDFWNHYRTIGLTTTLG